MRGLKLPDLSYSSLVKMALPEGKPTQIAFQTWITRNGDEFALRHYLSTIAVVGPKHITINGYGSSTTVDRLHTLLMNNRLRERGGYGVALRKGEAVIINMQGYDREVVASADHAEFEMNPIGGWRLVK